MKIGIVGLPNVGKSTLFNALTKSQLARAANFPFCTIDPNVGIVDVPDDRLKELANIVKPERVLSTAVEFVDIAGLVKGASEGEGLGNKFLAHIRECNAIAQVLRLFEDDDVHHVHGSVDAKRDMEIIQTELILADLQVLSKKHDRAVAESKSGKQEFRDLADLISRMISFLETGALAKDFKLTAEEALSIRDLQLLTLKPILYVVNISEDEIKSMDADKIHSILDLPKSVKVVPICAKVEEELMQMSDDEVGDFLKEYGLTDSGLHRLATEAYDLLGLQTYFTAGVKEVRAWTIHKGDTAPMAAGVIHTDFEKGFIRADVIAFEDFIKFNGEKGAREAGKLRSEGKEYIVKDGDVMHFHSSK